MFQAFLGPISELAGSFMQGQIEKQKAKATLAQTKAAAEAEIMKTAATHDSKWEIIMAQGTQNSWKDELVTVVILIPTILVFKESGNLPKKGQVKTTKVQKNLKMVK